MENKRGGGHELTFSDPPNFRFLMYFENDLIFPADVMRHEYDPTFSPPNGHRFRVSCTKKIGMVWKKVLVRGRAGVRGKSDCRQHFSHEFTVCQCSMIQSIKSDFLF